MSGDFGDFAVGLALGERKEKRVVGRVKRRNWDGDYGCCGKRVEGRIWEIEMNAGKYESGVEKDKVNA